MHPEQNGTAEQNGTVPLSVAASNCPSRCVGSTTMLAPYLRLCTLYFVLALSPSPSLQVSPSPPLPVSLCTPAQAPTGATFISPGWSPPRRTEPRKPGARNPTVQQHPLGPKGSKVVSPAREGREPRPTRIQSPGRAAPTLPFSEFPFRAAHRRNPRRAQALYLILHRTQLQRQISILIPNSSTAGFAGITIAWPWYLRSAVHRAANASAMSSCSTLPTG